MTDRSADRPGWWRENQRYKATLDLPDYEPPRFRDGSYVHEVVDQLEARFDCLITFVTRAVGYPVEWQVRVDGEPVMAVRRHRDGDGNTVYDIDAETFRQCLIADRSP